MRTLEVPTAIPISGGMVSANSETCQSGDAEYHTVVTDL